MLTARRFAGDIFVFSWHQMLTERLPAFSATVRRELTGAGLVLLAAGSVWMARHRRRELGLLALGFAGTAVVTLGVAADSDGFILPAFAFAWPAVGAGLEALLAFVDRTAPRRLAQAVTVPLTVALPLWLAVSNFAPNNHAHRRSEDVFFGALFEMLPDRAVIVAEEYTVNQLVLYQLLGAEAARGRDIRHVGTEPDRLRAYLEQGFDLFAFPRARKALEGHGMAFEPVQLPGPSLPDYLGMVRPGWIVAIASTPGALAAMPPSARRAAMRRAGLADAAAGPGAALAAIGVRGARAGSALVSPSGSGAVAVRAGMPIGQSRTVADVDVRVSAGAGEATISVGGSEVISAATGTVLVVMAPDGRGIASARVKAADGFRVPLDMALQPVYRAVFAGRCEELGNVGWKDVSPALGSGAVIARIDNYRTFDASMVIYAAAEDASAPRMAATSGSGQPRVGISAYDNADPAQKADLRRRMAADELGTTQWERPERYVLRIAIAVNDGGDYSTTTLSLGRPLPFGVARAWVDLDNPRRATLCSVQPGT